MNINKKRLFISIAILILIIIIVIWIIAVNKSSSQITSDSYTIKQAMVESNTIIKQLTNSMEVSSGLTEKVELHATYYFKELCVETNTYIKEGENILKYTNGTYLTAPYDCVLKSSSIPKEDEMITNSHYVELQTTETLSTTISVSESDMEYISLGKEVELTISAFEDKKYTGYVTNISETATNSKFSVDITFLNDGSLKLGMSGYSTIMLQEIKDVLVVPIEAIEIEDNTKYVAVAKSDGTHENVTVETGAADSKYVQITNGLTLGQEISYKDIATGNTTVISTTSNTNSRQNSSGIMGLF